MSRPAWQTEELDEEWIEEDEEDGDSLNVTRRSGASATSTISLTEAIGSLDITDQHRRSYGSQASNHSADEGPAPRGTFVVREGVEAIPLMAKTPGKAKGGFAGIFTPLALEKMFEPPSPPLPGPSALHEPSPSRPSPPQSAIPRHSPGPSPLSQCHLPVPKISTVQITPSASFQFDASTHSAHPPQLEDGDTRTSQIPSAVFTFTAPRFTSSPCDPNPGRTALAESTPGPSRLSTKARLDIATPLPQPLLPAPPMTDPRLRLFQFQYDTFTREHLSAILDTLPVHAGSPSTTNFSPNTAPLSTAGTEAFPALSELSVESAASIDRMRAAKRVKLSLRGESDDSSSEEASPPVSARSHRTSESYGEGAGAGAHIGRPKSAMQTHLLQVQGQGSEEGTSRRDYVKESMAFMQQLKAHRDFSTVSTTSAMADMPEGSRVVSKGEELGSWVRLLAAEVFTQVARLPTRHNPPAQWVSNLCRILQQCWRRVRMPTVIRLLARNPCLLWRIGNRRPTSLRRSV